MNWHDKFERPKHFWFPAFYQDGSDGSDGGGGGGSTGGVGSDAAATGDEGGPAPGQGEAAPATGSIAPGVTASLAAIGPTSFGQSTTAPSVGPSTSVGGGASVGPGVSAGTGGASNTGGPGAGTTGGTTGYGFGSSGFSGGVSGGSGGNTSEGFANLAPGGGLYGGPYGPSHSSLDSLTAENTVPALYPSLGQGMFATSAPTTAESTNALATVLSNQPKTNYGLQNNNPGNIRGKGPGGFSTFGSMSQGLTALDNTLQAYGKLGLNTPLSILQRYAPSSDKNNPNAYANAVAANLGITATTPMNMSDPSVRAALAQAITSFETGTPFGSISNAVAEAPQHTAFANASNLAIANMLRGVSPAQAALAYGGEQAAPATTVATAPQATEVIAAAPSNATVPGYLGNTGATAALAAPNANPVTNLGATTGNFGFGDATAAANAYANPVSITTTANAPVAPSDPFGVSLIGKPFATGTR